jgi:outer membrane protein OmpA-like peptidoglycan-associated protein
MTPLPPPPAAAQPPSPPPVASAPPPVPAPPPAARTPASSAPSPQTASLPPPSQAVEGRVGQIAFTSGAADLPSDAKTSLDRAVGELKKDETARLQIVAYATGGDDAGSQARRLSLSRALAVRSYLIDQGIRSTRMDVRALGNRSPDGPADRVDVVMVRR